MIQYATMEKTSLYQQHIKLGGRMVDFSGWQLPVEYKSTLAEAKATREFCGIFDASHMGEIEIKGEGALQFLQGLLSNDLSLIAPWHMQYNLILNSSGGIIDDCMVYRLEDSFICVVNASNKDKAFSWFNKDKPDNVEISDKSSQLALISLQGPKAKEIVVKVIGQEAGRLNYMSFFQGETNQAKTFLISRSGYTGEDGFEVYVPWEEASLWWDKFLDQGQLCGISPCGLGARDILRIEAGYPLYGHELDETINPCQANLAWAVKPSKDFIVKKKRIGFIMEEPAVARQGYPIYSEDKLIGAVTSGIFSPNLNQFIGMAYVSKEHSQEGNRIAIEVRGKLKKAKIKKYPFVKTKVKGNKGGVRV